MKKSSRLILAPLFVLCLLSFNTWGQVALEQFPNAMEALKYLAANPGENKVTQGFYVNQKNYDYFIMLTKKGEKGADGKYTEIGGRAVDNSGTAINFVFSDLNDVFGAAKLWYKWDKQATVSSGKLEATLSSELNKTNLTSSQKESVMSGVKSGLGL